MLEVHTKELSATRVDRENTCGMTANTLGKLHWGSWIESWNFTQAKWWKWRQTFMCSGSIFSCCLRNPHETDMSGLRRKK